MKKIFNRLGELVYLNLLFIVGSIPLITIGTAITSTYEILELVDKDFEINILVKYFEKFKNNFKKTIGINILLLILFFLFLLICKFLYFQKGIMGKIIFYLFISSAFLLYITFNYYYYLVSEFKERKNLEIIKYSLYLGIKNIGHSFSMIVIHLSIIGIIFFFSNYIFIIWEIFIIVGFSLVFYLNFKIFNRIKY